jgi:1,4-dihydroxy-2-naphthoate polyprenyltransferase
MYLYLALTAAGLLAAAVGAKAGLFPRWSFLATLAGAPFWLASARAARHTWDTPRQFIPAVKNIVLCYLVGTGVFTLTLLWGGR